VSRTWLFGEPCGHRAVFPGASDLYLTRCEALQLSGPDS